MALLKREDLHLLQAHSNLTEAETNTLLQENVYHGATTWRKFILLLLGSVGVAFASISILFFFAYNWADMPPFVKLGLMQFLIVAAVLVAFYPYLKSPFSSLLLTAACLLVGVLMAVFGQIYQTGADAYDLFVAWSVVVFIWVVVSEFPPLWWLYTVLLNTTFFLYADQQNINDLTYYWLQCGLNVCFFLFFLTVKAPRWLTQLLFTQVIILATMALSAYILTDKKPNTLHHIFALITLFAYMAGLWLGWQKRQIIYLVFIPFSLILLIVLFIIDKNKIDDIGILFIISVFIITSVTLLSRFLSRQQKKWSNEINESND